MLRVKSEKLKKRLELEDEVCAWQLPLQIINYHSHTKVLL